MGEHKIANLGVSYFYDNIFSISIILKSKDNPRPTLRRKKEKVKEYASKEKKKKLALFSFFSN